MMNFRWLKYLTILTLPALAWVSFNHTGWLTFLPVIEAFVLIPLIELFIPADDSNLSEEEEQKIANHPLYDFLVYLLFPIQLGLLVYFLLGISNPELTTLDLIGRTASMGLLCGVLGINLAHELGHRNTWHEQFMAKTLLLTSLYMHFFIEHNRGHHRNVGTPEDPSTAKKGEVLYLFIIRSVIYSFISAWKIEEKRLNRKKLTVWHLSNEMLQFIVIEILAIAAIYFLFGLTAMWFFIAAAVVGFVLLETVQYIEHYGLARKKITEKRYEDTNPAHSWNSNHLMGRLVLFELSRHSDHHYQPHRKYQILKSHKNSPQMPTGYPGMMLLSTIPPLWFWLMDKKVDVFNG